VFTTSQREKMLLGLIGAAGAIFLALFAYNSLSRSLNFSPDSMGYVDVAQNLAQGRGLNQSSLMTHKPEHMQSDRTLNPFVTWGPLYPILIAALHLAGIPLSVAALLIPMLASGLLLLLIFLFLYFSYSRETALLAISLLLLTSPLRHISLFAWSETTGILFLFVGLCLIVSGHERNYTLWAGIAFGLAYATRFALLPAIFIGILFLIVQKPKHCTKDILLLLLGFLVITFPIFWRNIMYTGHLLGPPRPPSTIGLLSNLHCLYIVLCQQYLDKEIFESGNQIRLALSAFVLLLGISILKKRVRTVLTVLLSPPILLLGLWSFGYMAFLVLYRTRYSIDPIDLRLLSPAMIPLLIIFAALAACAFQIGPKFSWTLLFITLAILIAQQFMVTINTPPDSLEARSNTSERLKWIEANTSEKDLIIGDSTMDIPLYCGFRHSLCFVPSNNEVYHPSFEQIQTYLNRHCSEFNRIFIIIRAGLPAEPMFEPRWNAYFGPFITNLVFGRLSQYPFITPLNPLKDAFIFQISCNSPADLSTP